MKIDMIWIDNDANPIMLEEPTEYEIFLQALDYAINNNTFVDIGINKYNHQRAILFVKNIKRLEVNTIDEI